MFNAQPKISVTSKLDGIKSWSLQALDTCSGSIGANGELVDACKGCYATTGNYRFANVKAPREHNKEDWKNSEWVSAMVQSLGDSRYFRWFDSGDVYDIKLAEKILAVMQATPWVNHWLPTRMHKFAKFRSVLETMQALPNVVVRYSSDSVHGETVEGITTSTIVPSTDSVLPVGASLCGAYANDGKCSGCRACWSKTVPVVAYPAHGAKMKKVITLTVVKQGA